MCDDGVPKSSSTCDCLLCCGEHQLQLVAPNCSDADFKECCHAPPGCAAVV